MRNSFVNTNVDGDVLRRSPHLKPAVTANLKDHAGSLSACFDFSRKLDSPFIDPRLGFAPNAFATSVILFAFDRFDVYDSRPRRAKNERLAAHLNLPSALAKSGRWAPGLCVLC